MNGNLEISTVIGCKMQCSYCPQQTHVANYTQKSNQVKMTLPDFKKFIETIPTAVDIVFAGMAEPFLNTACVDMMQHAFAKGHTISVYTTCYGMSLQDVEQLKKLKFNHFCIHLPDADGIMKLKVTPYYLLVLEAAMALQTNVMCIGNLHPAVREVIGFDIGDGSKGLYSRGGNIPHLAIAEKPGKLKCSACGPTLNHNVLLPNGDVLLCCMDYAQQHVLDNLNNVTYQDLFTGTEYKKIMEGLQQQGSGILCRTCEVSQNSN